MSFSSLPQELVDHLAFFVGDNTNKYNPVDVQSLYNLCFVSKQTLTSARAVLYRRPFVSLKGSGNPRLYDVQSRTFQLLRTLETDDCRFGQLVRDTTGVDYWRSICSTDGPSGNWYVKVLQACSNLQEVNLQFATVAELEVLLRILHLSPPATDTSSSQSIRRSATERAQLRCIVFDHTWESVPENPLQISQVFATLGRASIPSLNTVWFAYVKWSLNVLPDSIPLFPFSIKCLCIETVDSSLAKFIVVFPRLPSTLDIFRFKSLDSGKTHDLTPLTHLDTAHLRTLELKFNEYARGIHPTLPPYATMKPHLKPHLEDFLSYPLLTSLTLSGTHGPSLRLLSTLAKSSPLLRTLDLSNSRWISDSNPLSTIPDEIFPETRVLSALEGFKHIGDVHLGVLPTIDQDRYGTLVESLESRGVKIRFDCCRG